MLGTSRGPAFLLLTAAVLAVGACGSDPPATPSRSPAGSGAPTASASAANGSAAPSASPSAPTPSVVAFWQMAARALSRSGRMRLVMSGSGVRELRYEPRASGVVANGALSSVCTAGGAWTVQGLQSTVVPGKWACGASALQSSFRNSGQPVYAWSTRLPADTKIKETVTAPAKDRWQWTYTATSKILAGPVKTTLTLEVATGRLLSGSRTDPAGTTRYTFSYTTIFAPIALP